MENIFITNIHIDKVRHLENFDIELSQTDKKHLILTGKNGSGKTSLLESIGLGRVYNKSSGIRIIYNEHVNKYINDNISKSSIFLFIKALRILSMNQPSTITKESDIIDTIINNRIIATNTSMDFLQRMVNLYFMQLSAEKKQDFEKVKILENWFLNFTECLKKIYDCNNLKLEFDDNNFKYSVNMPDREPFGLNEMSDGYSAVLKIIIELINLMEAKSGKYCDYTMSGIVLIDEIETHLHIELQKMILPFLTTMFPNIQFIVSTHSPFVINSINNAVVFDLENKRRVEDLTAYSWETIVESYFEAGQYSHEITNKFNKYKELYHKERSHDEEKEFLKIRAELETVSPAQKELYNAFRQMELNLNVKAGG